MVQGYSVSFVLPLRRSHRLQASKESPYARQVDYGHCLSLFSLALLPVEWSFR